MRHKTEHGNREEHVHDQLTADEAIDQFRGDMFSCAVPIPLASQLINADRGKLTAVTKNLNITIDE